MADFQTLRIIGLAEIKDQGNLLSALHSLGLQVCLVNKLTEIPRVPAVAGIKDILLLPDKCEDGDVWIIGGILHQLPSPPLFLVYARETDFAHWSGVLDSGGADIITAPFETDKVRAAVELAIATKPQNGRE